MIAPLALSPALQRRVREAVGRQPLHPDPWLPAITLIPIPFGWTRVGSTLFHHFKEAPEDLLGWALSEEVAKEQGRGTKESCYLIAVLPEDKPFWDYRAVMEQVNDMGIGVAHAGTLELWMCLDSAISARDRRRAKSRASG